MLCCSSSPSRTSLTQEAQDLAPQEAMGTVTTVTARLGRQHGNRQRSLAKVTWGLSPPGYSVSRPPHPLLPTENSHGRRGAGSKLQSARRQGRTVFHRLTGHFGRRTQAGMKTNNVSPSPVLASPESSCCLGRGHLCCCCCSPIPPGPSSCLLAASHWFAPLHVLPQLLPAQSPLLLQLIDILTSLCSDAGTRAGPWKQCHTTHIKVIRGCAVLLGRKPHPCEGPSL